ncbi:MAG TPA: Flp family type IVb pilin [Alphaproteobacteria bacterium]|nr:Flp family type IVb pilin [Alphaproteobacteria bacterium]
MSRLLRDESGATVIEYGLIALLIATVLFAVLGTIGNALIADFNNVNAAF